MNILYGHKFGVVESGTYKGIKFYICSNYHFPTAYIENIWGFKNIHGKNLSSVYVHGGFTFCGKKFKHKCLGWDYAHATDYLWDVLPTNYGKQYFIDEILKEIQDVIDQMLYKFGDTRNDKRN